MTGSVCLGLCFLRAYVQRAKCSVNLQNEVVNYVFVVNITDILLMEILEDVNKVCD